MNISENDARTGWKPRYKVTKLDGKPVDPEAQYFVLRLDEKDPHGNACREVIRTYAKEIAPYIPKLAEDIFARYGK